MGNQEIIPATKEEIEKHFEQDCFEISKWCDIKKFKESVSDLSKYVGCQIMLEKQWKNKPIPEDGSFNK